MPLLTTALTLAILIVGAACQSTPKETPDGASPMPEGDAPAASADVSEEPTEIEKAMEPIAEEIVEGRWPKFGLAAGWMWVASFDTELRVSPKDLPLLGTRLDLEDDLLFDETSTILRLDAFYGIGRRSRFDFSYFDIDRSQSGSIDEEIHWDDEVIPVNTQVDAWFHTEIFKLTYRYNFVARSDWEMGASFGIHWVRLDAGIQTNEGLVEEELKLDAPLPLLGLHGIFALSENWRIRTDFQVLHLEIDKYAGTIVDAITSIEWDILENVGIALTLNLFRLDFEGEVKQLYLEAEYDYTALLFEIRVFF